MNDELPPLPNALHGFYGQPMYSSGQMSDYGLACAEAARAPLLAKLADAASEIARSDYTIRRAVERAEIAEARIAELEDKYQSTIQDWRNACELMNKAEARVVELEAFAAGAALGARHAEAEVERLRVWIDNAFKAHPNLDLDIDAALKEQT